MKTQRDKLNHVALSSQHLLWMGSLPRLAFIWDQVKILSKSQIQPVNCLLLSSLKMQKWDVLNVSRGLEINLPLLAVDASDNAICVLHGVKRFAATFGTHRPNEGNILAFKNDTNKQWKDLPQLNKMDVLYWYEATNWLHPNLKIMKKTNTQYSQVIPLDASCMAVNTSKIIPIPLFLVSFFMNRGILQSALMTCQAFHTFIFYIALAGLQDCLQQVQNFLIMVVRAEMKHTRHIEAACESACNQDGVNQDGSHHTQSNYPSMGRAPNEQGWTSSIGIQHEEATANQCTDLTYGPTRPSKDRRKHTLYGLSKKV